MKNRIFIFTLLLISFTVSTANAEEPILDEHLEDIPIIEGSLPDTSIYIVVD